MTMLSAFVLFGLPASLLGLGWAAVFLHERAERHSTPVAAKL